MTDNLSKTPQSLIFLGEEKEEMYLTARELAAKWLNTDNLDVHPDFMEVEPEDGSIGAEKSEIIRAASTRMAIEAKAVCIVKDAQTMTKELQNKLLKALEDGQENLAVIFITDKELLDTVSSRCMTVKFRKLPLSVMAAGEEYTDMSAVLASDGSPEMYKRIKEDAEFSLYLEGFHKSLCGIRERGQLKNILRLTHALKEKDPEYLPDKFAPWQMTAFLNLIKQIYWHLMLDDMGIAVPSYVRLGNLPRLYSPGEADKVYRAAENALTDCRRKAGFTKYDFFLLLMYMIPAGKEVVA